jgi:hypothetical protein
MRKSFESASLNETPNPVTPLDAGTGFCLHIERLWPGAIEFLRWGSTHGHS